VAPCLTVADIEAAPARPGQAAGRPAPTDQRDKRRRPRLWPRSGRTSGAQLFLAT